MGEASAPKVAWVAGVGEGATARGREVGRAVALLLAARGVAVVVSGGTERVLGACVGEAAFGGGKARHVVGGIGTPEAARACAEAVFSRFGACDVLVVVTGALGDAENAFDATSAAMSPGGRLVAVVEGPADAALLSAWADRRAGSAAARGLACHVVSFGAAASPTSAEPEPIAEAVVRVAGGETTAISGSIATLG